MGRNKQMSCKICNKLMRSDHLKSHMKKHVDLSSEDPEQICKSILEDVINDIHNKDETSMYRKKPRLNDMNSDGMDESPLICLHQEAGMGIAWVMVILTQI